MDYCTKCEKMKVFTIKDKKEFLVLYVYIFFVKLGNYKFMTMVMTRLSRKKPWPGVRKVYASLVGFRRSSLLSLSIANGHPAIFTVLWTGRRCPLQFQSA